MTNRVLVLGGLFLVASCSHSIDGPQPSVSGVTPEAACNDQVATVIMVSGDKLSPLHDNNLNTSRIELPQVSLTRVSDLDGASASDVIAVPNDPTHPELGDESWTSQQAMAFTICPPGVCSTQSPPLTDYSSLPPGLYTLTAKNRNGKSATLERTLTIVPVPVLIGTVPDLLCEDKDNTITLSGDYFIRYNGAPGQLKVGDKSFTPTDLGDCRTLPSASDVKIEACKTARVVIPAGSFVQGTYELSMVGPSPVGCHSVQAGQKITLTFVRMPTLTSIVPDVICVAESDRALVLSGADFLTVNGMLPVVNVGGKTYIPTSATDCVPVTGPGLSETVQQCKTLTVTIPQSDLDANNYDVRVTNPPPADCTSAPAVDLTVVPPPILTSVQPDLACLAQAAQTFTLSGMGFLSITAGTPAGATKNPTVNITQANSTVVEVSATPVMASCTVLGGPVENVLSCKQIQIVVPASTLAPGSYGFSVTNPDPAGCTSTAIVSFAVVPPPVLTSIAPLGICSAASGAQPVVLSGSDFLTVDGVPPSVSFFNPTPAGASFDVSSVGVVASNCLPVNLGQIEIVTRCTILTVQVPQGAIAPGNTYNVRVNNPAPAGCTSSSKTLVGQPPPQLTSVADGKGNTAPAVFCKNGGFLLLNGTNLPPGARVTVSKSPGGVGLSLVASLVEASGVCTGTAPECTQLKATFGTGLSTGTGYQATIETAAYSACRSGPVGNITVAAGPLLVFVDPQTVYSGIATSATIYASNVSGAIDDVTVVNQTSGLKKRFCRSGVQGPCDGLLTSPSLNRAVVTLPKSLDAGVYTVNLTDQGAGCNVATLADAFTVRSTLTPGVALTIAPSFGYANEDVAVTVTVNTPLDSAPRLYLSSPSLTSAVALKAVQLGSDQKTLTAVVPAGTLLAGDYDLVLTGTSAGDATIVPPLTKGDPIIAIKTTAYHANANPTPVITALNPSHGITSKPITFNVLGRNFDPAATFSFSLCNPAGLSSTAFTPSVPVCSGGSPNLCSMAITTTFSAVGVCVVRITNPDGAFFDFSALAISNPSSKLANFAPLANLMSVGRRALGAVAANATESARYLYAIGGDDGAASNPFATVESSVLDVQGNVGTFSLQRYAMVHPRTFVGAVTIGRFIYAVGGSDATGALPTVERAAVLNPLTVVNVKDVDIDPSSNGLGGGTWFYRVAPVMDATDLFNPKNAGTANPENLAGEAFTILLPTLQTGGLRVKLSFDPLSGGHVDHYNIYRNPSAASSAPGSEVLVGSTTAGTGNAAGQTFVDDGIVAASAQKPLPIGSTGAWTSSEDGSGLAASLKPKTLLTARAGAGVTAVQDPLNANVWYIYAFGGNSATEAAPATVASYEFATVTIDPTTFAQTMSAWTSGGANTLSSGARWQLAAYPLIFNYSIALTLGGTSSQTADYVYVGSGAGNVGLDVATVTAGTGLLTAFSPYAGAPKMPSFQGYGNFSVSLFGSYTQAAATANLLSGISGFLFAIGGSSAGVAQTGGNQSVIDAPSSVPVAGVPPPPAPKGWPNSASLTTARNVPASVNNNGYIYILGGSSAGVPMSGTALNTLETTLF